jgi:hypothetical protein
MQRMGLSDFALDDQSKLAIQTALSGAKLDTAVAAGSTDQSAAGTKPTGAGPSERSQSVGDAGRGPAAKAPEWVQPVTAPTISERSTVTPADAPHSSRKPQPLPEASPPPTAPNARTVAPVDRHAPPPRHAHRTESFPDFVMPPDPETWVKPKVNPGVPIESARQSLDDAVAKNLSPTEAFHFKADMKRFENRAKSDHLSDQQVADTYQNISQLLNAKDGPLDAGDRRRVAEQVIALSADPNKAVTGSESGTCGDAQLETLTYKNNPEAAANLVAQVAMGGTFTAKDGPTVRPDMMASAESRRVDDSGARLYASQIFQNTAIDLSLKELGSDLVYHHQDGVTGAGDGKDYFVDSKGKRVDYDGSYPQDLVAAYHGITGKNDLTVIDSCDGPDTENIKHVHSPEQLQAVLDGIQARGNTPTIIGVDERNQPFWEQNHIDSVPSGNEDPHANYFHWAAINNYDPKTGAISYHNGWDDIDHKISVNDMYNTTNQVDANLPRIGRDFVQTLKDGHGNYAEAIDALRIRSETGRISDADLNRLLNRDIEGLFAQRGPHSLDDRTVSENVHEIIKYLNRRKALSLTPHVNELITGWTLPPPAQP